MRSARRGARMFGIEVKPAWPSKMQSCSGSLKVGYDFQGGEPLWLALKLYAETRVPLPADNLRVESLVSELLRAVACRLEPSQISPLWLRRVQEKLHAEFYARITIDELALETGVHPVHLSRVAAVWGRELEITSTGSVWQACERMLAPEVPLADVSVELGFADQSHFSRTFHAIIAGTPGAFRAMLTHEGITSPASLSRRLSSSNSCLHP